MERLKKLIWMIFIFSFVFFIICDEKWYKIQWKDNQIFFDKIEKKSDFITKNQNTIDPNAVYKNSDLIHINYEFENPKNLRKSNGIDSEYLAKIEQEKKSEEEKLKKKENIYTWPSIINLENGDSISSVLKWTNIQGNTWTTKIETEQNNKDLDPIVLYKNSNKIKLYSWFENPRNMRNSAGIGESFLIKGSNNPIVISLNDDTISSAWQDDENENKISTWSKNINWNVLEKWEENEVNPELSNPSVNISEWKETEAVLVKIDKYQWNKHVLNLKKWKVIKHNFIVENTEEVQQTEYWLSDPMLESLLENKEIDINTLESENDEFLWKVFQQTKDKEVMNLIVETYLNEYQFVKAKKFIEDLPDEYYKELKPSLDLRVAFNSFSLSSKTITENLNSLVQFYSSKNELSNEDKNRYLWVISLIDRNYNKFFEISAWFTSEKNKSFASKLQWYKDQISKQMWMPEYYFDTLVSLELFNQWLFQPAKVLALYSLQQNSDYILPYQVLAYANFLTNSRDTSVEYLKKLVDLDPNNAEKYRFLIWVAYYRNEKYEQSVVMLSMIKDEKLRLDTQRYLINNYLKLNQKNKLISSWNKLLWSENLVASDFYTYFYETFFHPYSQWEEFQLYAFDTELANKMLRVCSITLQDEERTVCTYGTIGKSVALWQFSRISTVIFIPSTMRLLYTTMRPRKSKSILN